MGTFPLTGRFLTSWATRESLGISQVALIVKNLPINAGDIRDAGSIPGSGRSPGGGRGTPLQYSCPENPMDRGALQATAHRVTRSRTGLKRLGSRNAEGAGAKTPCAPSNWAHLPEPESRQPTVRPSARRGEDHSCGRWDPKQWNK